MLVAVVLLVLLVAVLAPLPWGPALHVWAGQKTISRLGKRKRLNTDERTVLEHPEPFLYGNIAADLISFKGFGGLRNHCHNWNMRERMLPFVTEDAERAFCLGYLCHLAADISSHNHFVPYHRVAELPPRVLGHAFWEDKADALLSERYWRTIDELRRNERFRVFDKIIDSAVEVKAFSLRSNRLIFRTIVLGQSRTVVRRARGLLKRRAPVLVVHQELLDVLKEVLVRDLTQLLRGGNWPSLVSQDPSGRIALRAAGALRRQLLNQYATRDAALPVAKRLARDCFWPR